MKADKGKCELWVLPPTPSKAQLNLYAEIVRQCRQWYAIYEGPALEYRVDYKPQHKRIVQRSYWIDIAIPSLNGFKIGIEVNEPEKCLNREREKRLADLGWQLINVPISQIDRDLTASASYVMDYVMKLTNHKISS